MDQETTENIIPDLNSCVEIQMSNLLGAGNESRVYKGIYKSAGIDKVVAIRVLHSDNHKLFYKEVQVATAAESPFLLRLIAWGSLEVDGENKFVELLPLADGKLDDFLNILDARDLVNVMYQCYNGLMDMAKYGITFSTEEMFTSQILLFNTQDKENLLVKISDFGSWETLVDINHLGYILSKFIEMGWSAIALKDAKSNNQLGIYTLNALYNNHSSRDTVMGKRYKTVLPKDVLSRIIELGNSRLPSDEYLTLAKEIFKFLVSYYDLPNYKLTNI